MNSGQESMAQNQGTLEVDQDQGRDDDSHDVAQIGQAERAAVESRRVAFAEGLVSDVDHEG